MTRKNKKLIEKKLIKHKANKKQAYILNNTKPSTVTNLDSSSYLIFHISVFRASSLSAGKATSSTCLAA